MAEELKEEVVDKIYDELFGSDLTKKQKKFVLYYLSSYNVTQSYMRAYDCKNKSNAYVNGAQLLRSSPIQSALKRAKKIMQTTYNIDPMQYLEFLLKAAYADIGDYISFSEEEVPVMDKEGNIIYDETTGESMKKKVNRMHLVNSDEVDTSIVTSIKQGRDGITINLVDKMKAWEKIKDFFEWQTKKEEKNKMDNNIIEAINNSAKSAWAEGEENNDLEEALKDNK